MLPNLEIVQQNECLHAVYRGELTLDVVRTLISEIAKRGDVTGVYTYFVDLRDAQHRARTVEDYNLAYGGAAQVGLQTNSRTILLTNPEEAEQWGFVETVFKNAGFAMKVYSDESAALAAVTE
jgi:hypothetical protein